MIAYLLLDGHGDVLGLAETREDAIEAALRIADEDHVYLDAPTEIEEEVLDGVPAAEIGEPMSLAANASGAPATAMRALTKAGFRLDFDAAASMTLEEAHQRIAPYFPTSKWGTKGKTPLLSYRTPRGMAERMLGQNTKIGKGAPRHILSELKKKGFSAASISGLSLLPNNMAHSSPMVANIVAEGRLRYGMKHVDHVGTTSRGRDAVRVNLCTKATAECIAACLTFSGQNLNDDYNTIRKFAATQALIRESNAFMRMLIEAIDIHQRSALCNTMQPLIRLNVYSDIPWELVAPGLFARFPEVQFYDYTKVPGRDPAALGIKNYDLTFSFSGSASNVDAMDSEIRDLKRRVAIVFAARGLASHDYLGKSGELRVEKGTEMPRRVEGYTAAKGRARAVPARLESTFLGLPLIDGDESDLRPYDPSPCIVGLRWKPPNAQAVTWSDAEVFVVEVTIVHNGPDKFDAVIAKTPRFDNVDFSNV